jgi:hypothetical protein
VSHPQNFSPGQFDSLISRCPHSVYRPSDSSVAPCSLGLCADRPKETSPPKKNKKRIAQILAEKRADIEPTVEIAKPSEESDDDQTEELLEEFDDSAIEEDEESED